MSSNFDKLPNEMFHEIVKLIIIDITVEYLIDLCTVNKRWCDMINTLKLYTYNVYAINTRKRYTFISSIKIEISRDTSRYI